MTKDVGLLILGLIVAAMPFLGFPNSIEKSVIVASGLLIALIAFMIRTDHRDRPHGERTESYVQSDMQAELTEEENKETYERAKE